MVVLVTGANGQLGQAIQSIAERYPDIQFFFYNSSDLDITDFQNVEAVFKSIKPEFCINAAAYTAVDNAESDHEKANQVNVFGSKIVAEICKQLHATLIHISTDFVFDGLKEKPYLETDITNPKGVYGLSKRMGEIEIEKINPAYFIVRTSWLYSQFGANFMKTMLRLAQDRKELSIVNDQIGTPTHALDLAEALIAIIKSRSKNYGIYHFSNEGNASWFDFAKKIFELNQLPIKLHAISTAQYPTPASRPKYSILDKTKIKNEFGISIAHWTDSLQHYL